MPQSAENEPAVSVSSSALPTAAVLLEPLHHSPVAELLFFQDAADAGATERSRGKVVLHREDDFNTFYYPPANNGGGRQSSQGGLHSVSSDGTTALPTVSRNAYLPPSLTWLGFGSKTSLARSGQGHFRRARSDDSGARVTPSPGGTQSTLSSSPFEGFATAFVHEGPRELGINLFRADGPLFFLRAGRPHKNSPAQASKAQVGAAAEQQDMTGLASRFASRCDGVHALDPFLLSESEKEVNVVVYKQIRRSERTVIELLHHCVYLELPGGDIVLSFKPFHEKALRETDRVAFDDLHERRKGVKRNGYSVVSGKETGCLAVSPDTIGCSQVRMTIKAEYDVELDDDRRTFLLRQTFAPLYAALEAYKRCDWVDEMDRKHFINVTIPTAPEATADELAMIDKALTYDLDDGQFQRVRGSLKRYPTISMFVAAGSSDQRVWGKGYGDVDTALEEVFAYAWKNCSYERMAVHRRKHGDLIRVADAEDGKRTQFVSSEQKTAPAFANRWYRTRFTWLKLDSVVVAVAFEPMETEAREAKFTPEAVEGKIAGLYLFRAVSPRVTTFTIVQSVDLGRAVPKWFAETLIPATCSLILRAQEKFRQPDRVVDKEMRETIAASIRSSAVGVLPVDKDAFDDCMKLKENFNEETSNHLVKILRSPSPFIAYSMRPAHNAEGKAGKRQVGTGKAAAVVDTSATDAAAWIFDACSRDRMRTNAEDNFGLPRIKSRTCGPNSFVVGTIKRAPFPLWNREFVIRMSWARADDNRLYVWAQSVNEIVDYGMPNVRKVIGSTSLIWEIFQTSQREVCTVTLYQQLDSGGWVPISVLNEKIGVALTSVDELRVAFQRDEEIDFENMRAAIVNLNGGQLDEEEKALFVAVAKFTANGAEVVKTSVEGSSDHFLKVFSYSRPSKTHPTTALSRRRSASVISVAPTSQHDEVCFEAEVVVDANIKECLAWTLLMCSRQRTQSFIDNCGGASRSETTPSSRRRATTDVYFEKSKIGWLTERREVIESVWNGTEDGSEFVVVEQHGGFELNDKQLKPPILSETTFRVAEQLSGSIPQTAITLTFVLGKSLASLQEEQILTAKTRPLSELRNTFDKSVEIDLRRREIFREMLRADKEIYADHERKILDEGTRMFSHFEGQGARVVAMVSPSTTAKVAYLSGDSRAWGWASGFVRADAVDVLAYLQDVKRRAGMRRDDVEKTIIETANNHNVLVYNWKKTPKVISDRDFSARILWRSLGEKEFEVVTSPEECAERPRRPDVVRAKYPSAWRIFGVAGKDFAKVEYVIHPDFGGSMPPALFNFYTKRNLERVTEVQDYFQRLRPLVAYDERDGAAVGETFMIKTKEEKAKGGDNYQIRVSNVVKSHVALKEFSGLNPWFPSLVEGMLSRRLRDTKNIRTKLENLSNKEALNIGHSFSAPLRARKSSQVGCDVWINGYPALVLLAKRERFFIHMVQTIGQRKIETAPWGLRWKVGLGAGLGILDVATDAYAIANFTLQGKHGYARAVMAGVSVSMAIQVLIVYGNGRKRGKRHVMKEVLIVLSGLKPAVDALRVLGGAKAHIDDIIDPMYELILAKVVEIVAESIPSSLVQIYALLTVRHALVSAASMVSIIISIATISFGSTTICFDFDLDPERRLHTPDFYGYVPNSSGKRSVVFYSMFCFTVCHVALRLSGIALLAVVSPLITATVLVGDMVIFMLFKLYRSDLRYWFKIPNALSWIGSIVVRLFTKLMVDFTVIVQLRHPQEIGGLYWCMCLLLGQGTGFVAVHLHSESVSMRADGEGRSAINLWGLMGTLEAAFLVFFAIFISAMNKKYVGTFFSTMTAKRFRIKTFREAATDQMKMSIFKLHPTYFESIRNEVKEWVRERWDTWNEERPEWFTERVRGRIPKDMIPLSAGEETSKE